MLKRKGVTAIFIIEGNDITMTKGDSGYFVINLKNHDGTEFVPDETDEIIFSVKRRRDGRSPIAMKKSGLQIVIEGTDTENLASGEYFYDVFIKCGNGERQTVIEGKFILRKAVHTFE